MSAETFWARVGSYNEALWPVQAALIGVALLPWALMGLPKCLGALDCYEDSVLFAAGVCGLVVLIRTWKIASSAALRPD